MAGLIALGDCWVDPEAIILIEPDPEDEGSSLITLIGGVDFTVPEPVDSVAYQRDEALGHDDGADNPSDPAYPIAWVPPRT